VAFVDGARIAETPPRFRKAC